MKNKTKIIFSVILTVFIILAISFVEEVTGIATKYFMNPFIIFPTILLLIISNVLLWIEICTDKPIFRRLVVLSLAASFLYCFIGMGILGQSNNTTESKKKYQAIEESLFRANYIFPEKQFFTENVIDVPETDPFYVSFQDVFLCDNFESYETDDNTSIFVDANYCEGYPVLFIDKLSKKFTENYVVKENLTYAEISTTSIIEKTVDGYDCTYICQIFEAPKSSGRKYESYFSAVINNDNVVFSVSMTIWHNDIIEPESAIENLVKSIDNIAK